MHSTTWRGVGSLRQARPWLNLRDAIEAGCSEPLLELAACFGQLPRATGVEPREKLLAAGSIDQTRELQGECGDRPGQSQGLHPVPQRLDEMSAAAGITQGCDLLPGLTTLQRGAQPSLPDVPVPQRDAIEGAEHEPRDGN
jgi:hypothetical protein